MRKHDRVVTDVHDLAFRDDRLRDLVGVTRRRDASPDVQELLYPRVTGEETDRPAEKRPVRPDIPD
jgi:hypothetical protein